MRALLRKDLPWLVPCAVAGLAALTLATCWQPFRTTFLLSGGSLPVLFYVAWIAGTVLGLVAAAFDEVLGVCDYVAQRGIDGATVRRARLAGCGLVLLCWFVFTPVLAQGLFALSDNEWEPGQWGGVPLVWGTMLPAVSACACALGIGSIQVPWQARLGAILVAGPMAYGMVSWCQDGDDGHTVWPAFVGGHVVITFGVLLWRRWVGDYRTDPDLPLTPRTRYAIAAPTALVLTIVWSGCSSFRANSPLRKLHDSYPVLLQHEGRFVCALPGGDRWSPGQWHVVDANQQPTGERIQHNIVLPVTWHHAGRFEVHDVAAPSWPPHVVSYAHPEGMLILDADGSVSLWPREGPRVAISKSDTEPAFAPGSRLEDFGIVGVGLKVVIAEPGADVVHVFDFTKSQFVPVPIPEGDRFVAFEERPVGFDHVVGQRHAYVLRRDTLQVAGPAAPPGPKPEPHHVGDWVVDVDGLGCSIEVPDSAGQAACRFQWRPTTAGQWWSVVTSAGFSVLGAPAMQVLAWCGGVVPSVASPTPKAAPWRALVAPVARANWFVLLVVALASFLTWRVRRRLLALGAQRGTVRFWSVATLLCGPVAWIVCALFETKRAYANRSVSIVEPPRIFTDPVAEESTA